jgi:hypothetical protein
MTLERGGEVKHRDQFEKDILDLIGQDGGEMMKIDCQYIEGLSYQLKRGDLEDWQDEADSHGRRPGVAVRIWPPELIAPCDVMILDMKDFAELLSKARKLDEIEKTYREMPVIDRTYLERDEYHGRWA